MCDKSSFGLGIDAETGGYLNSPASLEELGRHLSGQEEVFEDTKDYGPALEKVQDQLDTLDDVDVKDLASTGWAVIFSEKTPPEVVEALAPLLEHRRAAASYYGESGYREFRGETGFRRGESAEAFLRRAGVPFGAPADPEALPYYLLLVGGPEEIDLAFQYELDVEYAVGRIWFETPEEYRRYALAVVTAEKESDGFSPPSARSVFFAPRNPDDDATKNAVEHLATPLAEGLTGRHRDWSFETILGPAATKAKLSELISGRRPPAFLFTISHGLALPNGHERQRRDQGAVVCQEWPGPRDWNALLPPEFYFSADDLSPAADLRGTVVFQFACFSAGTPKEDDFKVIGDHYLSTGSAFLARLPQRLLAPPSAGGALAFIGHVDRVWTHSFLNARPTEHDLLVFEQVLGRLLKGHPVGNAMEFFNRRYAQLAVQLANLHDRMRRRKNVDLEHFAHAWLLQNDARNFILIGDPAVRLWPSREESN